MITCWLMLLLLSFCCQQGRHFGKVIASMMDGMLGDETVDGKGRETLSDPQGVGLAPFIFVLLPAKREIQMSHAVAVRMYNSGNGNYLGTKICESKEKVIKFICKNMARSSFNMAIFSLRGEMITFTQIDRSAKGPLLFRRYVEEQVAKDLRIDYADQLEPMPYA